MKVMVISLGAVLALAGCNFLNDEAKVEDSIRENLASRGEVTQVDLAQQEDGTFAGFAVVRDRASGAESRLNCTARRTEGTEINWQCVPTVDDAAIASIENNIREFYRGRQIEVAQIDLERADDDGMRGSGRIRDASGAEASVNCTATRENPQSTDFRWECNPAEEAANGAGGAAAAGGSPAAEGDPAGGAGPGGKPGADEAVATADGGGKD
ncbi:hypothetical protein [Sphingosinicella terrae]|uniref:hypothetical protein n=1 Tax=Sphingosinicella terrae TaxID=2172047 RepID=UPI000E0D911A|nr:hypothetical protein [Sphingosinicella terrae]